MCGEVLLQLEKTQQCPGAATFQAVYLASITREDVSSSFTLPNAVQTLFFPMLIHKF